MVHIKSWRIALPSLRDVLPKLLEAGPQILRWRQPRRIARRHRDIDRRQRVLIQTKGFPREALDPVARHGAAERARRDRQTESRARSLVGQNREAEERIADFSTALPDRAKFRRLVQSLARLERQPVD
jgi:hypothetical protein